MNDAEDRAKRAQRELELDKQELADMIAKATTDALDRKFEKEKVAAEAGKAAAQEILEQQKKETEAAKPQPEESHYKPHDLLTPIKSVAQEKQEKQERDEKKAREQGSFKEGC